MDLKIAVLAFGLMVLIATAAAAEEPEVARKPSLFDRYTARAQDLVGRALSLVGINYRFGGSTPERGFDCSGLVRHVFRDVLGLNLPRTSKGISRVGNAVAKDELKPGDLVFFNTLRRTFSHVGIYLGDHRFIHAPSSGGEVRIDDMREHYWLARFNGARRIKAE